MRLCRNCSCTHSYAPFDKRILENESKYVLWKKFNAPDQCFSLCFSFALTLFMEVRLSSTANCHRIKTVQLFYQLTNSKDSDHPSHIKTGR